MSDSYLRPVESPQPTRLEDLADDDLFILAKAGRHDAFETLVRRHQRLVLGLAVRFLGDAPLGRDAAQDVFLALWAERARYQPRGRLKSLLVTMTMNRCKYFARQRSTNRDKMMDLAREHLPKDNEQRYPLEQLLERERAREVRLHLLQLPEKTRNALILRYTHGMSIADIAAVTKSPPGTIKSHLSRGTRRLHKLCTGGSR